MDETSSHGANKDTTETEETPGNSRRSGRIARNQDKMEEKKKEQDELEKKLMVPFWIYRRQQIYTKWFFKCSSFIADKMLISFCLLGVGEEGICAEEAGKVGSSKQDCREGWRGVYKSRLDRTKILQGCTLINTPTSIGNFFSIFFDTFTRKFVELPSI